jgi:hypothetical protein
MGRQDRIDEDPLERRPVRHQAERREFGGDVIGQLVADPAAPRPRPDAPIVNKEMWRCGGRHADRIAAGRYFPDLPDWLGGLPGQGVTGARLDL